MTPDDSEEATGTAAETEDALGDPNGSPNPVLELDEVFAALGHPRRRYLLYTLVNGSTEAHLSDLAVDIAAWELEKPASEVTAAERRTVHISLYHSHIPKLGSLGIVDYHDGENVIVRAVNTAQVQAVLDGAGAELDSRQESHARDTDDRESG
jgi:hypothetical protein